MFTFKLIHHRYGVLDFFYNSARCLRVNCRISLLHNAQIGMALEQYEEFGCYSLFLDMTTVSYTLFVIAHPFFFLFSPGIVSAILKHERFFSYVHSASCHCKLRKLECFLVQASILIAIYILM